MKHTKLFSLSLLLGLGLVGCGTNNDKPIDNPIPDIDEPDNTDPDTPNPDQGNTDNKNPKIFLAGDSTVKTYQEDTFIGGWGQFLPNFVNSDIEVFNCAQGGRSTRSFINEGRLYNIEGNKYTFQENNGRSIEDSISKGDYLFIQFGHNDDDTKKASSYSTMFDRMVPVGTPDSNGIFPTTKGVKVSTTTLPQEYVSNVSSTDSALKEIAKYGDKYYSYDSGGTFKGYLKEYIDFARSKEVTPVLVTPVSRVKFDSSGNVIGGEGAHGPNLEYVEAVKQLAKEENCLLIDLYKETKTILETATQDEANYLMALKPNTLTGSWPLTYDETYGNTKLGYAGIEATHYNKYGAYLTAAKVAENILNYTKTTELEDFNIKSNILKTPKVYVDHSNLMKKSTAEKVENLFNTVNVKNPNKTYKNPSEAIDKIALIGQVTNDNYLEKQALCEEARKAYSSLNIEDRANVTNLNDLIAAEELVKQFIQANKPKPIKTEVFNANSGTIGVYNSKFQIGSYNVFANASRSAEIKSSSANVTYNDVDYSFTQMLKFNSGYQNNYIEISVTGNCVITIIGQSSSSATQRVFGIYDGSNLIYQCDAGTSTSAQSVEYTGGAKTLKIGSTSGGVYIYGIVIEYFA